MARRRYISTDISTDEKVNSVSNFAKLLYTWSIPHFADNCRITPHNAAELKWTILPALKEGPKEVEKAMQELFGAGLWGRDEEGHIFVPAESFYKYQTYINAANHRKTPQITASPSLSPSPSSEIHKNVSSSDLLLKQESSDNWDASMFFVRDFLQNGAPPLTNPQLLSDNDWWVDVFDAVNGLDLAFLKKEFAVMSAWLQEHPRRRPLPNSKSMKTFVRGWLTRSKEKERRYAQKA